MIVSFFIAAASALSSNASISLASRRKAFQFVAPDIVPIVLGVAVGEERQSAASKQHDAAKAAGFALPLPRETLLDHAAAEIGID